MTTLKSLPARPSFESIRKQAKKLARDLAAGDAAAVARARAQLPRAELPLSQRDAQLVLAREYGFAGWQDLRAAVLKRMGKGLEWAVGEAERAIHDDDVAGLKQLLSEYPALLTWRDDKGRTLLDATTSYAIDSREAEREKWYNRPACAEALIDGGAAIQPSVWEHIIDTGAAGMLHLLQRKGVLPPTLPILAALGDLEGVRSLLQGSNFSPQPASADDLATLNEALLNASRFRHEAVALLLLDCCIALDPDVARRIVASQSRSEFIEYLSPPLGLSREVTPWETFMIHQLTSAIADNDSQTLTRWLESAPELLDESHVDLQVKLLEDSTWNNREGLIAELLARNPAILRRRPPPQSSAIVFAFEYGNAHLIPLLARIWPLPDDLPHAAGVGDLARVKRWFDAAGQPALGNPDDHYPGSDPRAHRNWSVSNAQRTLDVALAWACMNRQFEVAAFLLDHGADINTNWSTHEPASILHECAIQGNYEAARFLIDRGIDLTILDHRYHATAEGWAYHAAKDPKMAELIGAAERERQQKPRGAQT